MEEINLPNGKKITMKEIVRKFAFKSVKDVQCIRIYRKSFNDFSMEFIDSKEVNECESNFYILTVIPNVKIDEFIIEESKTAEERRKERKEYKIKKEKQMKNFLIDLRKRLENGEEISLVWFADNIAYDIWWKDENGIYRVHKKDTEGEFDDNSYEKWTIDEIISEVENRKDIPEIIK